MGTRCPGRSYRWRHGKRDFVSQTSTTYVLNIATEKRVGYGTSFRQLSLPDFSFQQRCMYLISTQLKPNLMILSGSISISPSGHSILVHNLANGFDLYEITAQVLTFKDRFEHECLGGPNFRLPSMFLHEGEAVSGGSNSGDIVLWQTLSKHRAMMLDMRVRGLLLFAVTSLASYFAYPSHSFRVCC